MRKAVRIAVLFVLSALSTAVLAAATAVFAAISLAATTALIVPGTGTPNANEVDEYLPNYWNRYIGGVDPTLPTECLAEDGCILQGINYPASFFPLFFFEGWCEPDRCDTWNTSVGTGVTNLNAAVIDTWRLRPDDTIIIGGYSQGGAVASNELRNLAGLSPAQKAKIQAFLIGNAYNPDGGIFTRLGFLPTIPFLDITFGPAMPVDTGIKITSIGFQYDPVMYAPLYWGNPLALLNAFAAFDNVHGYYLSPNEKNPDPIAYGYTESELDAILSTACPGAYCRVGSEGNEYYMIPAKSLPLINLINSIIPAALRPFTQPIIELVTPALKVLIDLGYDWSGDPDQTRYLSMLPFNPFNNWGQVGIDLVQAVIEGVQNAFGGGSAMIAPPVGPTQLANTTPNDNFRTFSAEPPQPLTDEEDTGGVHSQLSQGVDAGSQPGGQVPAGAQLDGQQLGLDGEQSNDQLPLAQPLGGAEPGGTPGGKQPDERLDDEKDDRIDANGGSVSLNFSPNQPNGTSPGPEGTDQLNPDNAPAETPAPPESLEPTEAEPSEAEPSEAEPAAA